MYKHWELRWESTPGVVEVFENWDELCAAYQYESALIRAGEKDRELPQVFEVVSRRLEEKETVNEHR